MLDILKFGRECRSTQFRIFNDIFDASKDFCFWLIKFREFVNFVPSILLPSYTACMPNFRVGVKLNSIFPLLMAKYLLMDDIFILVNDNLPRDLFCNQQAAQLYHFRLYKA